MPADPNRRAKAMVDAIDALLARDEDELALPDPERVERGKLGGAKSGKLRAERLGPERRSEIAGKAAAARWGQRTARPYRQARSARRRSRAQIRSTEPEARQSLR